MTDDRSDRIRQRAYQIWQEQGEPHGHDGAHWDQAEREIGQVADLSGADEAPAHQAPVKPLSAEELSEPAASAAPDPVTDGTPARPAKR